METMPDSNAQSHMGRSKVGRIESRASFLFFLFRVDWQQQRPYHIIPSGYTQEEQKPKRVAM